MWYPRVKYQGDARDRANPPNPNGANQSEGYDSDQLEEGSEGTRDPRMREQGNARVHANSPNPNEASQNKLQASDQNPYPTSASDPNPKPKSGKMRNETSYKVSFITKQVLSAQLGEGSERTKKGKRSING
jgi:hypothetical protein